jgi:putative PIG3 family NAD(P)H quinone oxidoreductase
MLPATMIAINITAPGGPEVLRAGERPVPRPGAGQVLIKVAYAGVNRHDCGQRRRGHGPAGATDVPGLEVSGEIVETGAGTTRWKPGDRVCALVNGGGYAQYCIAEEPITLPIPAQFDLKQAAALPETFFTAWFNVFIIGKLAPGEWLLVHGGSSGVGTTAIQLGKLEGARVLATAGSAAKCDACMKLGATRAINYREQDFVAAVCEATGGHGADVILDMAGAAYARRNLDAVALDGRIVHVSGGDGAVYSAPLASIMARRARITGSQLRASSLQNKTEIARQLLQRVWPHLGRTVAPVLDSVIPLEQAAQAHARMESSAHIGKILLEVRH